MWPLVLTLVVSAALGELAYRFLLFSGVAASWSLARSQRDPRRFADWRNDELWFVLQWLWSPRARRETRPVYAPRHDERLGWTSDQFLPGDYRHLREDELRGRRPVLLFGDSFSACVSEPGTCFESLMEGQALSERYAILNYGCRGYGLDQVYLLLEPVLARYQSLEPLVVIGVLVDDDLDRCVLAFRCGPKPRLQLEAGRLVQREVRVPTVEEYLRKDPPLPSSYLARRVLRLGSALERRRHRRAEAEKQDLARALLQAIVEACQRRELPLVFLLFNTPGACIDPGTLGWRQGLVRSELTRLGAPWVESREELLMSARVHADGLRAFFREEDGHLNALGNEVVHRTLLRGLAALDVRTPPPPWTFEPSLDPAGGALLVYKDEPAGSGWEPFRAQRLIVRGGREPTRLRYRLDARCQALSAEARSVGWDGGPCVRSLRLLVDGEERWSAALDPTRGPRRLDLDLSDRQEIEIEVTQPPDTPPGCYVVLSGMEFSG